MNKTTTKKHAVQSEKKGSPSAGQCETQKSFQELMLEANPLPNQEIIKNIVNYSKALKTSKTQSIGSISHVMN